MYWDIYLTNWDTFFATIGICFELEGSAILN